MSRQSNSSFLLLVALLGSIIPDLDFLPGILIGNMRAFHHGVSHSLLFAVLFGGLTFLVAWRVRPAVAVGASALGTIAYTSHVLLDFVSVNPGTLGVPLLWPLSDEKLGFSLQVFGHFRYSDIRDGIWSVVRWENVSPLLRELSVLGGLVVILLLRRRIVSRSVG